MGGAGGGMLSNIMGERAKRGEWGWRARGGRNRVEAEVDDVSPF
jgi:hypothetical protein